MNGTWRREGDLLLSPLLSALGLRAGMTTRPLGSMGGRATHADDASRARDALARRLGFETVVHTKQVHGDVVVRVDGAFASPWPEADAMWTDRAGVLLGVVAGDCVPVLVGRRDGRIGAAHAGWEGTTRSVARRLVETMGDGADMVAAIGPSIGPCCYTVGPDRAVAIRERLGAAADEALVEGEHGTVFDLWAANARQLREAGVAAVEIAGTCTKCGAMDLFSLRGGDVGLLGMAFIGRQA